MKLSSIKAEVGSPLPPFDWHGRIEQHLRRSAVPAVILRSSFYMSDLFASAEAISHSGKVFAPADGAGIAMIDPRDVAAVAAVVLTTDGHEERTYQLTGSEAITYGRIAEELSAATGRHVEFVDVPDETARQGFASKPACRIGSWSTSSGHLGCSNKRCSSRPPTPCGRRLVASLATSPSSPATMPISSEADDPMSVGASVAYTNSPTQSARGHERWR